MSDQSLSPDIVLIGMPAVGKSTVGVLLAKELGLNFVDTDLIIQSRYHQKLEEIIKEKGKDIFRCIEEGVILSLSQNHQLIATGGSVVYSERAMDHLHTIGIVIFLDISIQYLKKRLHDLDHRGVVHDPGQSIEMLFGERKPLYERHADIKISCDKLRPNQVVTAITKVLGHRLKN